MRQFFQQQRNRIWLKAVGSSAIICVLIYVIIRCFSFDFPMSWKEEIVFFFKVTFSGMLMIVFAVTTSTAVYKTYLRIRRNK